MSLKPIAVQIGATTEHEVSARYNLYRRQPGLRRGAGVDGRSRAAGTRSRPKPEAKPDDRRTKKPEVPKIKLRFTVAADAVPGVRSFRVIDAAGRLDRRPVGAGARPGDLTRPTTTTRWPTAQAVTLPATLCGAIEKAEDVDYFKFTVPETRRLTFHVQSPRCENKIHDLQVHSDPILTLRNASGTVLASNDNFFFGDPLLALPLHGGGRILSGNPRRPLPGQRRLAVQHRGQRSAVRDQRPSAARSRPARPRESAWWASICRPIRRRWSRLPPDTPEGLDVDQSAAGRRDAERRRR